MKQKLLNFNQYFESVENDDGEDLKVINYELPDEVKKTTLKILRGINDVKDPKFYSDKKGSHIVEYKTSDNDFKFIDEDQELKLDDSYNIKKKLEYDVTLSFDSKSQETHTVVYKIEFTDMIIEPEKEEDDEDFDDDEDTYYKPDLDDDYDVDELDKKLNPKEIEKQKFTTRFFDDSFIDDDEDEDL